MLREFPADDPAEHALGDVIGVGQFEAGSYVNVQGTSKGRGFAGGVKRWGFRGGPKTHGQSDRHRAPGSVGAGTTPGKVWKGQKMAGHMGARTVSVLNLLVVAADPSRDLLFVEGSVPGPPNGIVQVTPGRKAPLAGYEPPAIEPAAAEAAEDIEPAETIEAAEAAADDTAEAALADEGADAAEPAGADEPGTDDETAEERDE